MTTMTRYALLTLLVQALLLSRATGKGAEADSKPNIIFVVADDLGWNDVGFHDNPAMKTPVLDKLASEGVILNRTYVQPLCSPSRSCFMSGRFPFHTGLQHIVIEPELGYGLNLSITTTAQHLKELGYATHMVGKWHLGFCSKAYTPTQRGFDSFFGYYLGAENYFTHRRAGSVPNIKDSDVGRSVDGLDFHRDSPEDYSNVLTDNGTYSTYAFSREAVAIVTDHNVSAGPLYLYMPFQAVHAPLQAPERFLNMYSNIKDKQRRVFSAMVSAMDEAIGNITQALEKRGMWDNTLLVFTTDNGGPVTAGANNWPLRGSKATVWEGGTRGSAFIHGTMLNKTGYTYDGMTHAVDWYPTLVAAAGGEVTDPGLDGMDLWEVLKNGLPSPRQGFVYNIDTSGNVSAIRVGNWKYIKGHPGPGGWYPPANESMPTEEDYLDDFNRDAPGDTGPWLFDLEGDPLERENLYTSMPGQVKVMEEQLAKYMESYVPDLFHQFKPDPRCDPALYHGAWSSGWC